MDIDQDKLMDFLHRFVGDLGAAMAAGNVVVGDRLGLYRALAAGPLLPNELAERTGTAARYVDEWRGAGGRRLRRVRRRDRPVLAHPRAGVRADQPGRRGVRPGRVPARAGHAEGRAAGHRSVPDRGWPRLARARRRGVRRMRAVLPARVHRQPDRGLAACPGRRDRPAAGRGPGGGHRLRPRGFHHPDGAGLPRVHLHRLGLPRGVGPRHASGPRTRAWPTGSASTWRRPRRSAAARTIW